MSPQISTRGTEGRSEAVEAIEVKVNSITPTHGNSSKRLAANATRFRAKQAVP
jgi:hypothetical protein